MEYTLLSLNSLPFILPIFVCAIIFSVAQYVHLNFKHIQIKTVSSVMAVLTLPIAMFMTPLIVKMSFDYNIPLVEIHTAFSVICFSLILCVTILTPKSLPNPLQILGLLIFCYGVYSFLA